MIIHKDSNGFMVSALGCEQQGYHYKLVFGNGVSQIVSFQYGDAKKEGINGLTNEALLNILVHRIGALSSPEHMDFNNLALIRLEEARLWLRKTSITKDQVNIKPGTDIDSLGLLTIGETHDDDS